MEVTNNLIQAFQVLYLFSKVMMIRLSNYDHILYEIDRLNYCSLLMNSIPLSSSKSQIQSSLLDMSKVLSTSKRDIENLIQHIYYSICSTSSSYPLSMKDVCNHFRIFIYRLLRVFFPVYSLNYHHKKLPLFHHVKIHLILQRISFFLLHLFYLSINIQMNLLLLIMMILFFLEINQMIFGKN